MCLQFISHAGSNDWATYTIGAGVVIASFLSLLLNHRQGKDRNKHEGQIIYHTKRYDKLNELIEEQQKLMLEMWERTREFAFYKINEFDFDEVKKFIVDSKKIKFQLDAKCFLIAQHFPGYEFKKHKKIIEDYGAACIELTEWVRRINRVTVFDKAIERWSKVYPQVTRFFKENKNLSYDKKCLFFLTDFLDKARMSCIDIPSQFEDRWIKANK